MAKYLVIVESPAKAKTLKKYLGDDFQIKATLGHVVDLPTKELGVDVEKDFKPSYVTLRGRQEVLKEITEAAAKSEKIYLAPDPDREGEAIAWHVARAILSKKKKKRDSLYRATFHEITKNAVRQAIDHPSSLDEKKFNAQQARRILDRLVGYQISPVLWEKVKRGLSAGRVQSVAVRLVVEREREIRSFVPQEYWSLDALLEGDQPPPFKARLHRKGEEKLELKNQAETEAITEKVRGAKFEVVEIESKERRRFPTPPFITSTLQQEAARKLHFTAKRTMMLAQQLYEGVELGSEGSVGLITYMRTDSTHLANEAVASVRTYIVGRFGKEFVPESPNVYKNRKQAQEAHEAVRPTSVEYEPDKVKPYLEKDLYRLYELIWNRFIACQMAAALYDVTTVDIQAGEYRFRATGSILKFAGFIQLYVEGEDEKAAEEESEEGMLPPLKKGQILKLQELKPEQHFTKPPPRFRESSLVKELEEKGIGRPSTYASILSTIQQKSYVHKEKGVFSPTDLGELVTDLLIKSFPRIMDVEFTAGMEDQLDQVEEGEMNWLDLLRDFWSSFEKQVKIAKVKMRDVRRQSIPTDIVCDRCGSPMVIRWGRHGEFLSCSTYPECKNIKEFEKDENGKITVKEAPTTTEVCEKCGKPMAIRRGRYGQFLACTGYPDCKNTRAIHDEGEQKVMEGVPPCPQCGGKMLAKRARAGQRFIACENYPKCKEAQPFPIGVNCPDCGSPLVEKSAKGRRIFYGCSRYPDCQYATWEKPSVSTEEPKAPAPVS
jgi:DNA topoisomerase-1